MDALMMRLVGDDLVVAPDAINTLKISTLNPDEFLPGVDTDLYDAHDSFPPDIDLNNDGDFYDFGERGGDGYIDVNDVIYSLGRDYGSWISINEEYLFFIHTQLDLSVSVRLSTDPMTILILEVCLGTPEKL